MNNAEIALFSIIALCFPIFGGIIYFGLKSRNNFIEQEMEKTNAAFVKTQMSLPDKAIKSIVYGCFTDASSTKIILTIRDINDETIAKATFGLTTTSLEFDSKTLYVRSDSKLSDQKTIYSANDHGGQGAFIATRKRTGLFSRSYEYEFKTHGKFVVQHHAAGKATVFKDDKAIGKWLCLGSNELSAKALAITTEIPLLVQIVLLSGPFNKRQSTPY